MKFREIVKNTSLDFIGMRNKTFVLSAVLICLGIVAFVMVSFGRANMSVDFTGGTNLQIKFADPVAIGDLRDALFNGGLSDVQIQEVAGTKEFMVKRKWPILKKRRFRVL